jgi:integrase
MPSLKQKAGYDQHTHLNPRMPSVENGNVIKTLWEMKKEGKADATIKNVKKALSALSNRCNLSDPEAVKIFIATLDSSNGYKKNLSYAYDCYVKFNGLTWKKPKYFVDSKFPKIPQKAHINAIIADVSKRLRLAICISRDTGLRPIEIMRLRLRDVDLAKGAIYPATAKHGSPRMLKLKSATLQMLNAYLVDVHIEPNEKRFGCWNSDIYGRKFRTTRNRVAYKLNDPTIKTIRLYDLRHYFATMLFAKTNDILFVKQQMGHKKLDNTMKYTQILNLDHDDNYTCKIAQTIEEDRELIENGFQFVTERDGLKIYRKRK